MAGMEDDARSGTLEMAGTFGTGGMVGCGSEREGWLAVV